MEIPVPREEVSQNPLTAAVDGSADRTCQILFLVVFAAMLGHGILLPVLPIYAQGLGATGLWIGIIFSGYSFSRVLLMPAIGRLSDYSDRKTIIIAGLILYTIFSFLYLAAGSPEILALLRFIHGFASAMVVPVAIAFAADLAPPSREGEYMGTFVISFLLGMGLGPFIGGILYDRAGMAAVFIAMAALSAAALVICLLLPPSPGAVRSPPPIWQILRQKGMAAPLFFQLVASFLTAVFIAFFPLLAKNAVVPLSAGQIGIILSANLIVTAGLQYHFGKIADRHDKRLFLGGGLLVIAGTLAWLPCLTSFPAFVAAGVLLGVGAGISIPAAVALMTIAGRSAGQGSAMGAYVTIIGIGMMIGPVAGGLVYDALGLSAVFLTSAAMCFLAVPVTVLLAQHPAGVGAGELREKRDG